MSRSETVRNRKQSIIAGGLISSAGLFFAKFIGLFYAVPFNTLLGSDPNIAIYGVSYQIYSYVLNICTAGLPFAIATMVARYSSRGDYQTTLLVKKLSTQLMIGLGLVAMLVMIACSSFLAPIVITDSGNAVPTMRIVLILISFALFFVPMLSSLRGFYQGLKHMDVYALSQVLEQIARIAFLLMASAIAIYMFNQDHVWSVYFGALAASISAILAIVHLRFYDRKCMPQMKKMAKEQTVCANTDKREILRELCFIALPYFFSAVLGYSDTIINTIFLSNGIQAHYRLLDGVDVLSGDRLNEATTIIGAVNYGVLKLMSIPMILAPGFSSAIIPHITSAITLHKTKLIQKNIRDCVEIILYVGLPVSFCLFVFAKPIYAVLFDTGNEATLELSAQVLQWFSIEAFVCTIGPVFTSLMMVVGLRKLNLRNQLIMVALKFICTYPMLIWLGYQGLVLSSLFASAIYIYLQAAALTKRYHMDWKNTYRKLFIIVLGMVVLYGVAQLCAMAGLKGYGDGRLLGGIQLALAGTISMFAYVAFTYVFGIPQMLFHMDIRTLLKKVKRK